MSDLPSPSKSPEPITCQAAPGLKPTLAPERILLPSISQTAGVPSAFCHRMSALPSPSKSPLPIACHDGPGLKPTLVPETRLVPSSDQTAAVPSVFCQRRPLWPLPLKSFTCERGMLIAGVAKSLRLFAADPSLTCHSTDWA